MAFVNLTQDVISIRQKSKSLEVISEARLKKTNLIDWLEWDSSIMKGKFLTNPIREQIPENIKEQLIVELYSK